MFLKYQESTMREVGESNIYNLIQYDRFDAVVEKIIGKSSFNGKSPVDPWCQEVWGARFM